MILTFTQEKRLVTSKGISHETMRSLYLVVLNQAQCMSFVKLTKILLKILYDFDLLYPRVKFSVDLFCLQEHLVPIKKSLTSNEYALKDSFDFIEEIVEQSPVGSLGIDFSFTNISLGGAIDIYTNRVSKDTERKIDLPKIEVKELLSLAAKEFYLIFPVKLYKQVDKVAVRSPLKLTLANVFLIYFEKN